MFHFSVKVFITDRITTKFDNIVLAGDLNYDTLDKTKGATLLDLCDIFDFSNLKKTATCFMKNCVPSLVDVVITNQPRLCFNALNFGCGISDWHNMIGVAIRGAAARVDTQNTKYRSYKGFDQVAFNNDIGRIPSSMRHMHLKMLTISIGPMRGSCPRSLINTHQLKSVNLKPKNQPS